MHASSIYSGHSHMLNVSNKTCTRLKHLLCFIIVLHRIQEDGAVEVLQRMNYLIKRVFSERNTIIDLPSHTIEQANQEV